MNSSSGSGSSGLRTVASTVAACSPPITEIRAFGHRNRNRGEYARPHIE